MKLSDIMGHAGLAFYAEAALVIFFIVFVGIVLRVLWPSRKARYDADARMPLDDETPVTPRHGDKP